MDSQTREMIGIQRELRSLTVAIQKKSQTKVLNGIQKELRAIVNLQLYLLQDKYLKETNKILKDRAPHGFDIEKDIREKYQDYKSFIKQIAYPDKK